MKRTIYRGRVLIWCFVLMVSIIWTEFIPFMGEVLKENPKLPLMVYSSVNTDMDVFDTLDGVNLGGYKVQLTSNKAEADIIISDSDEYEGYTKYADFFQSPIVLYAGSAAYKTKNTLFVATGNTSSESNQALKCDLYVILTAMEKDMNWEDIGVIKDVATGPVTLYIPDVRSYYYKQVEDLFYLTLNDLKTVTEEDRLRLKDRVDKLLGKCVKVSDITQEMRNEYSRSKTTKIFIGPEFLYLRDNSSHFGTNYTSQFRPIYTLKTKGLNFHLFIKESDVEDTLAEDVIEDLCSHSTFNTKTGYRVRDRRYNTDEVGYVILNQVLIDE